MFSAPSPRNKTPYPSVTQVFGHYLAGVPLKYLEYAGDRGTRVHSFCTRIAVKAFIPGGIDQDCLGYVMSFEAWLNQYVQEVLWVEREFIDPDYGFCGHPDMGVVLKEGPSAVVDLKTPQKLENVWAGQLAAYRHLAQKAGQRFDRTGTLRLNPHGGPATMKWYQDSPRDLAAFISLLTGYKYFFSG